MQWTRKYSAVAVVSLFAVLLALPSVLAQPGDHPVFDEHPGNAVDDMPTDDMFSEPMFDDDWSPIGGSFPFDDSDLDEPDDPGSSPDEPVDNFPPGDDTGDDDSGDGDTGDDNDTAPGDNESDDDTGDGTVTEEAYIEPVPEPGDPYFEAQGDGWISYVNPRDEYYPGRTREEYPGSGKVCMTLLNENGEPITGETLPGTQASMDMGGLEWHSHANPFTVQFPLTEHYDQPYESDQFGTSPDLPQGDGYLDAHCFEFHAVSGYHNITYDPVEITGQHADDVEVVGYYDQLNTWDSDFDPLNDVSPYGTDSSSDGFVSMSTPDDHAEVLAVLQLNRTDGGDSGDGSSGDCYTHSHEHEAGHHPEQAHIPEEHVHEHCGDDPHHNDSDSDATPPGHPDPACHYHYDSNGSLVEHCQD